AVKKAKDWLHDFLTEHGEVLRNDIIAAGKAAGLSRPAIVQAKAISADSVAHTPQGIGPSKWYLKAKTDSVESVLGAANKLNQLTRHNGSAADHVHRDHGADATVVRLADFTPKGSKRNPQPED